jgi:hypothetical protein
VLKVIPETSKWILKKIYRVKEPQRSVDSTLREVEIVSRESEKDTRDRMREVEDRIDASMGRLEKKLKEQLEEALTNPLNNMNK